MKTVNVITILTTNTEYKFTTPITIAENDEEVAQWHYAQKYYGGDDIVLTEELLQALIANKTLCFMVEDEYAVTISYKEETE